MERRRMKAASLILEYMLLFMFGIAIFIASMGTFIGYDQHFNNVSMKDQLVNVREYVSSNIIKLSEKAENASSITIKIPKKAGREDYKIELSGQGINVTSMETGVSEHSGLYNLSQNFELKGRVISRAGSAIIYKTGNQIIIS